MICQVEVTRFEELEETHAEVKLKQTLWQSQTEWARDYDTWMTVRELYHRCLVYVHCTMLRTFLSVVFIIKVRSLASHTFPLFDGCGLRDFTN